jgi:uncharacterized membrane protein SpoIIM required for sporulation
MGWRFVNYVAASGVGVVVSFGYNNLLSFYPKSQDGKHFLVSSLFIILGIILSYNLENQQIIIETTQSMNNNVIKFDWDIFFHILPRNIIVGILIAVCGFISAGIGCFVILFWNGMNIGCMVKSLQLNESTIPYFVYHGIFEIAAFLGFSVIGMKGVKFFIDLFKHNILTFKLPFRPLLFSAISISIAAIIETLLISSISLS